MYAALTGAMSYFLYLRGFRAFRANIISGGNSLKTCSTEHTRYVSGWCGPTHENCLHCTFLLYCELATSQSSKQCGQNATGIRHKPPWFESFIWHPKHVVFFCFRQCTENDRAWDAQRTANAKTIVVYASCIRPYSTWPYCQLGSAAHAVHKETVITHKHDNSKHYDWNRELNIKSLRTFIEKPIEQTQSAIVRLTQQKVKIHSTWNIVVKHASVQTQWVYLFDRVVQQLHTIDASHRQLSVVFWEHVLLFIEVTRTKVYNT